ncbi:MAG: acyl-CoA dehydrogenase family protein [Deltaproteobacteria bacterium]|nr:acyl-CoA dehydrogenase family protein [Deltaproteobacteria bacterium]
MITSLLHDDMKSFQDLAHNFASKELAHRREESDRYPFGLFDDTVLAKAHELGFLGITLPEDMGGIGQGVRALCVILECICRTDASLAAIIFTNTLAQEILLKAGAVDLLRQVTVSNNPKDILISFPSYSNPEEHKNLPFATKGDMGYSLSGSIDYVVLAPIASQALIPARITGQDGYSLFLVDLRSPKVKKGESLFSLGVHACPVADITLNGAEARLVGQEGKGPAFFEETANMMYVAAAAVSLGIMKGSFDYALTYSNEREQGGWPIINWSEMKMILADMAIQMNIAEMAVSEACNAIEKKVAGWDVCAKTTALHVQNVACLVTTDGIQILGGYGYMKDYGQEKRFRDAAQNKALLGMAPLRKMDLIDQINSMR